MTRNLLVKIGRDVADPFYNPVKNEAAKSTTCRLTQVMNGTLENACWHENSGQQIFPGERAPIPVFDFA